MASGFDSEVNIKTPQGDLVGDVLRVDCGASVNGVTTVGTITVPGSLNIVGDLTTNGKLVVSGNVSALDVERMAFASTINTAPVDISPVDSSYVASSLVIETPPHAGLITAIVDGVVTYTPEALFVGMVVYTYLIVDSQGQLRRVVQHVAVGDDPGVGPPVVNNDILQVNIPELETILVPILNGDGLVIEGDVGVDPATGTIDSAVWVNNLTLVEVDISTLGGAITTVLNAAGDLLVTLNPIQAALYAAGLFDIKLGINFDDLSANTSNTGLIQLTARVL